MRKTEAHRTNKRVCLHAAGLLFLLSVLCCSCKVSHIEGKVVI